jgi:hypothetical protein
MTKEGRITKPALCREAAIELVVSTYPNPNPIISMPQSNGAIIEADTH